MWQRSDRAVSLLYAANVREELVKMANEYIDLVNGASLSPSSGSLGTSRTSFLSRPGTKGYISSIPGDSLCRSPLPNVLLTG
jgi:hypothetical protein